MKVTQQQLTKPMDHGLSTISRLLIANRGEISSRVSRTCRKMGITSIAVYSDADRKAPFVTDADEAMYIGESSPSASYLDQEKIINVAKQSRADAIHPGYGFLSENADFARRCKSEGITFIGPNAEAIEKMGSKAAAKELMAAHNVPIVPGYQGRDQSIAHLTDQAQSLGYPVLLKATAGGGGRGMRIVRQPSDLDSAISAAKRESKNAFGDDQLILEKYIESGRHIEFQIFGDQHNNVIHLLERECSIQRRYQKVIEESPSPIMTDALRERMAQAALQAAKALNYDNAGTVEFIYDDKTEDFYFLEVNTRLQVEHPVTEEITGLDLVQIQIESASGQPLTIRQEDIESHGYAIEARLYAEDPNNNFMPVTGSILTFENPNTEGLRIETAVQPGSEISIFYDPMIAKIVMHGRNRQEAIRKLNYALRHMVCQGITTNLDLLIKLSSDPAFISGQYDTHFLSSFIERDRRSDPNIDLAFIAASYQSWLARNNSNKLLKHLPSGWRNNYYEPQCDTYIHQGEEVDVKYRVKHNKSEYYMNDRVYHVTQIKSDQDQFTLEINDKIYHFNIALDGSEVYIHNPSIGNFTILEKSRYPAASDQDQDLGYITPMPAQIVKVLVAAGDKVKKGQDLIVLTSMKMESTIQTHREGEVEEVYVASGQNVAANVTLLKIKEQK